MRLVGADSGSLTGVVSNVATGNFLEGAKIEIPALRLTVLTDETGRFVPAFTEQIPLRHQHRAHQLLNLNYQERFDVLGGERNLGVSLNLFHSEEARGWFNTVRDVQNTANEPQVVYRGTPDQLQSVSYHGVAVTLGVSGRF